MVYEGEVEDDWDDGDEEHLEEDVAHVEGVGKSTCEWVSLLQ